MGKGECGGEMRAGVGDEVSKYKNTPMPHSSAVERIFFRAKNFFVDDDSGLSAIWSVHYWTEFL
jgi:hypothetical protein